MNNFNEIVGKELEHIPANSSMAKDFRAVFQRERLKTLSKNQEPVAKTLLRLLEATHSFGVEICPRIFVPDIFGVLEPLLPINYLIEKSTQEIERWEHLPSGKNIMILRPANYRLTNVNETKMFIDLFGRKPTFAYTIHCSRNPAFFDMSLVTSKLLKGECQAYNYVKTNARTNLKNPFSLNEEIERYEKFVKDVADFVESGGLEKV